MIQIVSRQSIQFDLPEIDTFCIVALVETFSAVIDRWPEPAPVTLAADLGEEAGTVRQWRNRNVLPDRVWLSIVEAAKRRDIDGVTLEVLASIARRKKATSDTQEGSPVRRRAATFPPEAA